jgi:NTP pyrophosphatase (non-canonical NTP hydrolase)
MTPSQQVTLDNYVDLAGRTEASVDSQILDRISDPRVVAALIHYLDTFARVAKELDHLKKFIFYGKQLPADFFFPRMNITPSITARLQDDKFLRLLHGVLGVATEAGEMVSDSHKGALKGVLPVLRGQTAVDMVNFLEEAGDTEWYLAQIIRVADISLPLGMTFQQVLQTNIDKLRARYPEKFTAEDALNRDEDAERKILEGQTAALVTAGHYDNDLVPAGEN